MNVRVRSYFGPDFQCGGMGIEKSTAFDEDYRVVLPRYIEALWISYAENQVYYLYEELPYDEIERQFGEGYDFYEDRNSEPKKVNFDVINLCFLPEGKVALYLNGTTRTILLDWSAQGKATDEFNDEIDQWVIDAFKAVGLDTAKAVLGVAKEDLVKRVDLEEETIDEVIAILAAEFEE